MVESALLTNAVNLTLFGMGFVFLFLTVLVFVTGLMSFLGQRFERQDPEGGVGSSSQQQIDEETKFVIEQAIKMHRGA